MSEHFEIEISNKLKVIRLLGNMTSKPWMDDLIHETNSSIQDGTTNFIIDLKGVELINSSGLSMLVNILTKARRSGGDVLLCNINATVRTTVVDHQVKYHF